MAEQGAPPTVVIVGRPNVGKSTLFNSIIGQRRSIVGDEPGITRDRIHGEAVYSGRRFELIDTGGIIPNDAELIPGEILKQARVALEQASNIVFLIDGRTEITSADRDLAQMLRQLGRPVTLAVNKIDSPRREDLTSEFYSLGFPDVFPVSAEHKLGIGDMLDHITQAFPREDAEPEISGKTRIKVAIIGRPNVGKSTLLNSIVGAERAIVSPIAGTTRDAVDEVVEQEDTQFVFVDTAGIRRKGKTHQMVEKLSVVMARRNIRMANVVVLVIDASEGIVGSDATIAGYAHEEGRSLILCVNKWDITAEKSQKAFIEKIGDEFKFLDYAPVVFLSAKTGSGVKRLFGMIRNCFECASKRVSTGELNRFLETLEVDPELKIRFMTQASVRPPTFVLFTSRPKRIHFSFERYMVNQIRKRFGFECTPIVIRTRATDKREREKK
jgi:GTP-binding protein